MRNHDRIDTGALPCVHPWNAEGCEVIVNQEEAATRGCPLRVTRRTVTMDELTAAFAPGQLGNGTIPTVSGFAPCLHEQCMAWRWADPGMDSAKLPDSYRVDDNPRGYCGLAGTPLILR